MAEQYERQMRPEEGNQLVQKSRPIAALWTSELTLSEFKILDTYLARIDAFNDSERSVTFSKGEIERLLGVSQIKRHDLENRLDHLMQSKVKVYPNGDKDVDEFEMIMLFEQIRAKRIDGNQWSITLMCTESARKYFFNIKEIGYIRYRLRVVREIESRYTYLMFMYLEINRYRKTWVESIDKLRHILQCDEGRTGGSSVYEEFKHFNAKILKKVQQELQSKTICRYTYEPIREYRAVVAIKFTVEKLPEDFSSEIDTLDAIDVTSKEIDTVEDTGKLKKTDKESYLSAAVNNSFPTRMKELQDIIESVPESLLPPLCGEPDKDTIESRRYKYLEGKYQQLQLAEESATIRYRFAYLKKIIENDIKEDKQGERKARKNKTTNGTTVYKNFKERNNNNYTQMILDRYSKK